MTIFCVSKNVCVCLSQMNVNWAVNRSMGNQSFTLKKQVVLPVTDRAVFYQNPLWFLLGIVLQAFWEVNHGCVSNGTLGGSNRCHIYVCPIKTSQASTFSLLPTD